MIDAMLRAADPAAEATVDVRTPEAQALLARILAAPRTVEERRGHRVRRMTLAAAAVTAALTVGLAVPMPWQHEGGTAAAFAVTTRPDGSYRVVIKWADLKDPGALQAALDRVRAPVRVLTGVLLPRPDRPVSQPPCAEPTSGQPYSAQAVEWDFPDQAREVNGFVVHPSAFPTGGVLVVEVFFAPGRTTPSSTLSYMTIGGAPTCAQNAYDHP
jgi:hypothetical protein